jgi:hypothetical protein
MVSGFQQASLNESSRICLQRNTKMRKAASHPTNLSVYMYEDVVIDFLLA